MKGVAQGVVKGDYQEFQPTLFTDRCAVKCCSRELPGLAIVAYRHSLRLGELQFEPPLMSPTGKSINALLEELGATVNVSA